LKSKDLLGIKELTPEEINLILDTASNFKNILQRDMKKVPTLRGKTVVNFFHEPSTRTMMSFELAAKRLGADMINFSTSTSSILKGESLRDTVLTIQALGGDYVIIRHSSAGLPHFLARHLKASVINAGDGSNEHPTQALIDIFTIKEKMGCIEDMEIAIVGDITHSRVAKSDIYGLTRLGAKVRLIGSTTLIPSGIESLGVTVYNNMERGLKDVDVIIVLRVQMERQRGCFFPNVSEYFRYWGLTEKRLSYAKDNAIVMHPGPLNREVEIDYQIADGHHSVILDQVTNGIAVRMAVLYLLFGVKG
jgi:aspartate carbamoyltransferase catalytic subunit